MAPLAAPLLAPPPHAAKTSEPSNNALIAIARTEIFIRLSSMFDTLPRVYPVARV
jgi:hypothetical protein